MIDRPYPYFGGKGTIADEVWKRFGDVDNFVEGFYGGGDYENKHRERIYFSPHCLREETLFSIGV